MSWRAAWRRSRLRAARGDKKVLHSPVAAHEPAERARRLAQRAHVHVDVVLNAEHLRCATAGGPAGERAVGVVHHQQEAVALAQGGNLAERGEIPCGVPDAEALRVRRPPVIDAHTERGSMERGKFSTAQRRRKGRLGAPGRNGPSMLKSVSVTTSFRRARL